jgi:hypothetical protein
MPRSMAVSDHIRTMRRGQSPDRSVDCKGDLLAILPDAKRNEQRNQRRFLVKPDAPERAVEDSPDDRLIGEGTGVFRALPSRAKRIKAALVCNR